MQILHFDLKGRVRAVTFPDPVAGDRDVVVCARRSVISTGTEIQGLRQNRRSLFSRARGEEDLWRRLRELHRMGLLLRTLRGESPTGAPFPDRLRKQWPLGYAAMGVVETAGALSGFMPGDRVACAGHPHADRMRLPASLVVPVPAAVDDESAAFAAIGAIALHAIHRARVGMGDIVPVIGLGLIGLLCVQILRAYAVETLGVDPIAARRDHAVAFGAGRAFAPDDPLLQQVTQELSRGRGADAVLVTAGTGSSAPLTLAARLIAPGGRITLVGATGMTLPRADLYRKEADLLISRSYGPGRYDPDFEEGCRPFAPDAARWTETRNLREFLRLASHGGVTPARLVSRRVPFSEAARAYDELLRAGTDMLTCVLTHGDAPSETPKVEMPSIRTGHAPIPVAVIGHGEFARRVHLPALAASERYELRRIVGRDPRRAREAAARFGAPEAGDRVEAILEDQSIVAVFVLTRHDTHATLALRLMESGKGVFVEKPLALTLADAERVCRSAEAARVPFAVGFNRRHSALAARCRAYAARRSTPIQTLYRVAGTFLPAEHWVYDRAVGGGRVLGEACHFIDFLRWVMDDEIVAVDAAGGNWTHPGHPLVDNFSATFRFASGGTGTLLYGDLGRVDFPKERFELFSGEIALALDDFVSLRVAGERDASIRLDRPDKGFEREIEAFADYVSAAEPGSLAGPHDGLEALRWGLAIEDEIERRRST